MHEIRFITGTIALILLSLCLVGYGRLMTVGTDSETDKRVHHLIRFVLATTLATMGRNSWWDLLPVWMDEEVWRHWVDALGGRDVNSVFHVILIYGGLHGLVALQLFIPEPERHRWSWWNAWIYPPCIAASDLRACTERMISKVWRRR